MLLFSQNTEDVASFSSTAVSQWHTHSWTSLLRSNTPRCSPYCSLHAWSNTHKESVSYIHLLLTFLSLFFFFCLCNLSLYKWSQAGSPYLERRRQREVAVCHGSSRRRSRSNIGKPKTWGSLELLFFFCRSLVLEATFEDGGVGVRWEEGLYCEGREGARLLTCGRNRHGC